MKLKITLSPQRRDDRLTLHRNGDTLTINGEAFDFSAIPDGATLPREAVACDWLASDVTRDGGVLCLTLILPHGPDAPHAVLYPEALVVDADGAIDLPSLSLVKDTQ